MNERYDVDWIGREDGGGTALDVRSLLEDASWPGQQEVLDPHEHWTSGRRRRSRKRAGAGVLGGVALVTMAGLVWQAGVFGGEVGPLEPHVATLPSGLTTFVLAAPETGADGVEEDGAELQVADAEELAGTSWELTDQVWGSDASASEIVGSDAETVFSFGGAAGRGWGFAADECGGGWFQEDLRLTGDGSFAGGDLGTSDVGCPAPAQTAEDFWLDVLAHGGTLHTLDRDWLLLSVDTTQAGMEQPPPVVVEDATRLVFVRPGTDPGSADLSGPERVPSNEELAGSRWQLSGDAPGTEALRPWLEDPARLQVWFADGWPASLALVYGDGCLLAQLRTEGVDGRGATVPIEGLSTLARTGTDTCPGAEEAGPALAEALEAGAQVTLVGEDALLLRLAIPAGDGVTQTAAPSTQPNPVTIAPAPPTTAPITPEPTPTPTPAPSTPAPPTTAPGTPPPTTAPGTPPPTTAPGTPPPTTAPGTPPTAAPTPPSTPTSPPPGPGEILAGFSAPGTVLTSEGWPGSGGDLFAPTVRAGANEGFDRVVLDLTGTGTPTWLARYTGAPVRDGSGLPMVIAGDSVLELVVTGMTYPEPGDPVYDGGDFGLDTHRLGGVYEVIRTTPFEGQLQLFVGVQGEPRPYRVFLLQDPLRLVVDVQTS